MPALHDNLFWGMTCTHTVFYLGIGAMILVCCGMALCRSHTLPSAYSQLRQQTPQDQEEDFPEEKGYLSIELPSEPGYNRNSTASVELTQPMHQPHHASSPMMTFPESQLRLTQYNQFADLDMNPQSYLDEPSHDDATLVSSPMFTSEATLCAEPASLYQQPLSDKSWFDTNPRSYYDSPASSYSSISSIGTDGLPRRRSYTKQTSSGGSVSGEIITGDTWRRHTRVFGGGVCKACEESEERMRKHGLAAASNDVS